VNCIFYNFSIILYIFLLYANCLQLTIDTTKEENNNNNTEYQIRLRFCKTNLKKIPVTIKFCTDSYNYTQIFRILQ